MNNNQVTRETVDERKSTFLIYSDKREELLDAAQLDSSVEKWLHL